MLAFLDIAETAGLLRVVAPACKEPDEWARHLSRAMYIFGISNDLNFVAAFVAQLMVESAELNRLVEDLNYRADRLMVVWPKRFPTVEIAQRYAHNPEALATFVYANRLGNGPPDSGDAWRFIGRGGIMTTGLDNYRAVERATGLPVVSNPELLEQKEGAALSAALFWWNNRLSFLAADLPDDDQAADFVTISRRVQGGKEGLARRQRYWRATRTHLGLPTIEVST